MDLRQCKSRQISAYQWLCMAGQPVQWAVQMWHSDCHKVADAPYFVDRKIFLYNAKRSTTTKRPDQNHWIVRRKGGAEASISVSNRSSQFGAAGKLYYIDMYERHSSTDWSNQARKTKSHYMRHRVCSVRDNATKAGSWTTHYHIFLILTQKFNEHILDF